MSEANLLPRGLRFRPVCAGANGRYSLTTSTHQSKIFSVTKQMEMLNIIYFYYILINK